MKNLRFFHTTTIRATLALVMLSFVLAIPAQARLGQFPTRTLFRGETITFDLRNYGVDDPTRVDCDDTAALDCRFDVETFELSIHPKGEAKIGLHTLTLRHGGEAATLVFKLQQSELATFTYPATEPNLDVFVAGNFNNWSYADHPLTYDPEAKAYTLTFGLQPGRYEYKIVVDGNWLMDPTNPDSVSNGLGGYNSSLVVEGKVTEPGMFVKESAQRLPNDNMMLTYRYVPGSNNAAVRENSIKVLVGNRLLDPFLVQFEAGKQMLNIFLNKEFRGTQTMRVLGEDRDGQALRDNMTLLRGDVPRGRLAGRYSDWYDGIVYSLFVDRFFDGDTTRNDPIDDPELADRVNFAGGDLVGVMRRIDEGYFEKVGVNALWLSPIYDAPEAAYFEHIEPRRKYSGYHGYWPIHPERIEQRFGKAGVFKYVVEKAHANDLRILLDFVSNHVHEEHSWFKENPQWFGTLELPDGRKNLRLFDEYRLTTWFDEFLPSFDFPSNPDAVEVVTDNAVWWLEEFNVDGYRHDAVKHVPNFFWRRLTEKIHDKFSDREIYQIGETYGSHRLIGSYVNPGQLDGQFDFNLLHVMQSVFGTGRTGFTVLDDALHESLKVYGPVHLMGNLIGNHDKVRFMALADNSIPEGENPKEWGWQNEVTVQDTMSYHKVRAATAFTMTIPGVPFIYYGDEIGMTGAGDPDNRRMMRFGDQLTPIEKRHFAAMQQLCQIRKDHPALKFGDLLTLHVAEKTYAFARVHFDETLVVAFNMTDQPQTLTLAIDALQRTRFADVISGESLTGHDGELSVAVKPFGYRILQAR